MKDKFSYFDMLAYFAPGLVLYGAHNRACDLSGYPPIRDGELGV